MPRYVLSIEAKHDLEDIRSYFVKQAGAGVARYVTREIAQAFEHLAALPRAGHTRPDLTEERVRFWQVFSYLIVYDAETRPVGVARVLHARRDLEAIFRDRPARA